MRQLIDDDYRMTDRSTTPAEKAPTKNRALVLTFVISVGLWLLIASATLITRHQFAKEMGHPFGSYEIAVIIINSTTYALLTPFVFWITFTHPIGGPHRLRQVAAYLAGGIAFSLAHAVIRGIVYPVSDMPHVTGRLFRHLLLFDGPEDLFEVYLPIVVFGQMASYYQRLRDKETQLTLARLQLLKSKLHPHFLFNTMHSISALMFRDVRAADTMISRLSDLLRLALDAQDTQETTLARELEFLDLYLKIEQIRFQDRLQITIEPEPQTLNALVPHLILQPLVENAIRHGISVMPADGKIKVASQVQGKQLLLRVTDNGPGYRDSERATLEKGLGLSNTRKRLDTLYGNSQRLAITNTQQGGVEVCVEIPFRPGH